MTEATVPDDILPDRIQGLLHTESLGWSLDVRTETESTMDDARRVQDSAPEGHLVLADRQTRGRGAHGRTWDSAAGTDLYFSFVIRPALTAAARPMLTLAVGLGVAEAAEELSGKHARIKWPNDVWLRDRKCAGILVETGTRGEHADAVIVGIGLNVNRRRWPDELRDIAISIADAREDRRDLDRAHVLARTLEGIEAWIARLLSEGPRPIVDALSRRLALVGEEVQVDGVQGVLEGVTDGGAVRIRTPEGTREVLAGTLTRA